MQNDIQQKLEFLQNIETKNLPQSTKNKIEIAILQLKLWNKQRDLRHDLVNAYQQMHTQDANLLHYEVCRLEGGGVDIHTKRRGKKKRRGNY